MKVFRNLMLAVAQYVSAVVIKSSNGSGGCCDVARRNFRMSDSCGKMIDLGDFIYENHRFRSRINQRDQILTLSVDRSYNREGSYYFEDRELMQEIKFVINNKVHIQHSQHDQFSSNQITPRQVLHIFLYYILIFFCYRKLIRLLSLLMNSLSAKNLA